MSASGQNPSPGAPGPTPSAVSDQLALEDWEKQFGHRPGGGWSPAPGQGRRGGKKKRTIPTRRPGQKAPPDFPSAKRKPRGKRLGYDPHRRRKWISRATVIKMPGGVMRLCGWLTDHSNDGLKPVWGAQETMAEDLGVNERTIRRWLVLLESAGLIEVERADLIRNPDTGQIQREHSNTYTFTFPAVDVAAEAVQALLDRQRDQRLSWATKKARAAELAALAAREEEGPAFLSDRTRAPSQLPYGEVNPPGRLPAQAGTVDNPGPALRNDRKPRSASSQSSIEAARTALAKIRRP